MQEFLNSLPDWLHIFIISMLPVVELRAAIPYGLIFTNLSAVQVFLISLAGNMLPAPLILYLADGIFNMILKSKNNGVVRFAERVKDKNMRKSARIKKLYVLGADHVHRRSDSRPGVWTGCTIAALLRLEPLKSVLAALVGATIAGIVVTLLVKTGIMLVTAS
jgi:uncharacterized membrane protein